MHACVPPVGASRLGFALRDVPLAGAAVCPMVFVTAAAGVAGSAVCPVTTGRVIARSWAVTGTRC